MHPMHPLDPPLSICYQSVDDAEGQRIVKQPDVRLSHQQRTAKIRNGYEATAASIETNFRNLGNWMFALLQLLKFSVSPLPPLAKMPHWSDRVTPCRN